MIAKGSRWCRNLPALHSCLYNQDLPLQSTACGIEEPFRTHHNFPHSLPGTLLPLHILWLEQGYPDLSLSNPGSLQILFTVLSIHYGLPIYSSFLVSSVSTDFFSCLCRLFFSSILSLKSCSGRLPNSLDDFFHFVPAGHLMATC